MTPNLAFWIFAFAVMSTLVVLLVRAIMFVRAGDIVRHRRTIAIATWVVVGFVACYAVKVLALGREDKSDWSRLDLVVLYTHESLVGIMLLSGLAGGLIGRRLYGERSARGDAPLPPTFAARRRRHQLLGRVCAIAAVLALVTGGAVLYGMVARLG